MGKLPPALAKFQAAKKAKSSGAKAMPKKPAVKKAGGTKKAAKKSK